MFLKSKFSLSASFTQYKKKWEDDFQNKILHYTKAVNAYVANTPVNIAAGDFCGACEERRRGFVLKSR